MKNCRYITFSDIHFGHKTNTTPKIISNMNNFFKENDRLFRSLDAMFLLGDLFDTLLSSNTMDYKLTVKWFCQLAKYCETHNIKLRLLLGTYGHDYDQGMVFEDILKEFNIKIDFKYINNLEIEYIEDLDMRILYMPDDLFHNQDDAVKAVEKLYEQHNIKEVDLGMFHGLFTHQLPLELPQALKYEDFKDKVKHYIHIGHIHKHSSYGKVIAQGSIDRLTQNEEESKGLVYVEVINDEPSWLFIKNPYATIFKTITIRPNSCDTVKGCLKLIKQNISKLIQGSCLRVKYVDTEPYMNVSMLKNQFPDYVWSVKKETLEKPKEPDDINEVIRHNFVINNNTIEGLLREKLIFDTEEQKKIFKVELDNAVNSIK